MISGLDDFDTVIQHKEGMRMPDESAVISRPGRAGAASWSKRLLKVVVSLGLTVVLFIAVLPLISNAPWPAIGADIRSLSMAEIAGLTVLWFLGLYAHSFVLTAAMPPLTHRRALTLSLTGSAVSNVVPLGGAIGIGLNRHMSRTWGFSNASFALFAFVTNLWDVLMKLSLPAVALAALLLAGDVTRPQFKTTALSACGVLVVLLVVIGVSLGSERATKCLARGVEKSIVFGLRLFGSQRKLSFVPAILELRGESISLFRRGWAQLSLGMITYSVLQALLLYSCLNLFGSTLSVPQVFAGYALERVLTIAMITPGGAGVVEVGITALLAAFGGAPVETVAGVLVYRAFTFGLEIPVGATGLAFWMWHHRAGRRKAGQLSLEPHTALEPHTVGAS